MKDILIVGDPHQWWDIYFDKIEGYDYSVCLGDVGLGIVDRYIHYNKMIPEGTHYLIRGNHDDPETCKHITNCLPTFGSLFHGEMFYIAGATVPPYICGPESWGDLEQLSLDELETAIELYAETKPLVVVSHEAPYHIAFDMHDGKAHPNRTSSAFDRMLEIHKPNKWIFGHHHKSYNKIEDNCLFLGLAELETHLVRL